MTPIFAFIEGLPVTRSGPPAHTTVLYEDGRLLYDAGLRTGAVDLELCQTNPAAVEIVLREVDRLLSLAVADGPGATYDHDWSADAVWRDGALTQLDGPMRPGARFVDLITGAELRAVAALLPRFCEVSEPYVPDRAVYGFHAGRRDPSCWPRAPERWPEFPGVEAEGQERTMAGADAAALAALARRDCIDGTVRYVLRARGRRWEIGFDRSARPGDEAWLGR